MFSTAAGTVTLTARVFVIGAGESRPSAIATSCRLRRCNLGSYDMRPIAKLEQVMSLGGRFAGDCPSEAKSTPRTPALPLLAQDEEFYRKQRELLGQVVSESDVVITTAVIPGKKAPTLVTAEMVQKMVPGSVIVDLAAERGGNCELTHPGEIAVEHGVTLIGLFNLASTVPHHASQMYAKNLTAFLPAYS